MNNYKKTEYIIKVLGHATKKFSPPLVDLIIDEYGKDPYLILISCILSLRAKDIVTIHVCRDLFEKVRTPKEMLTISEKDLEKIIFRSGFYKNKAKTLKNVSKEILDRFGGKVPSKKDELLSIKGIGDKTANLVLGLAFDIPAICVDTHVHRISNRLGVIDTKTSQETEIALQKVLPKKYWILWNKIMVIWGQNVCVPISPFCSKCEIRSYCDRVGVTRSR